MAETNISEDILSYAINREVEANTFYNLISEYAHDKKISQLCIELAAEELEHKSRLELEMMKTGRVVKTDTANEDTANPQMHPLDYISDSGKIMHLSMEELLLIAIKKEQAAFRFYVDMAGMVGDEESREMLIALAEEETRHRFQFETEYNRLQEEKDSAQDS